MPWLPGPDELLILPVEDVAIHLLRRIATHPNHEFRADKFTGLNGEVCNQGEEYHPLAVRAAVSEAIDWLYVNGLIVGETDSSRREDGFLRISRKGLRIAEEVEPIQLMNSERLLSLKLHPAIDQKARVQFAIGAYGSAVFEAFRSIEIRVRDAAGLPARVVGDDVMRNAFSATVGKEGPLTDLSLEGGEQRAIMELFAGAIGAFKNPLSHRVVDFDDPTVAAEQVMFADLLHRMLDSLEAAKAERETNKANLVSI